MTRPLSLPSMPKNHAHTQIYPARSAASPQSSAIPSLDLLFRHTLRWFAGTHDDDKETWMIEKKRRQGPRLKGENQNQTGTVTDSILQQHYQPEKCLTREKLNLFIALYFKEHFLCHSHFNEFFLTFFLFVVSIIKCSTSSSYYA